MTVNPKEGTIAVAATAPFGADVLERLAARHDVAYLLTRPDRPRGRGRKPGSPPAKKTADRLGIPVRQPERLDASFEPAADAVIVVAYDENGGRWDHVAPPKLDKWGPGSRVPTVIISPYAKKGFVDHQTLSFDAYLKFIEDDFLHGRRIDPKTDGRPDPRPDVRENEARLGDLAKDFDFTKKPRRPILLPLHPA